jgi:hypothetical protein
VKFINVTSVTELPATASLKVTVAVFAPVFTPIFDSVKNLRVDYQGLIKERGVSATHFSVHPSALHTSALLLLRQRLKEKASNYPPEILIMTDQLLEARAVIDQQQEELIKSKLNVTSEQWAAIDEKIKQCVAAKRQLSVEVRKAIRERFNAAPIKSAAANDSPAIPLQP